MKIQSVHSEQEINAMRLEIVNLKKPQKVQGHLAELKQIKQKLYDSINHCSKILVRDNGRHTQADADLFELEFGPLSEMSRFLSWEIMHL
jgi:hypothetical protein